MTDKVHVDLHGAAQTMLTTLYCKARDADLPRPVLGDRYARAAASRIDYAWHELGVADRWTTLVTVRAALYDIWTAQFLAANPRAAVIHLGCGLDSRVLRLDPGPDVHWYDVDQPEVIALREKVFTTREHCGHHCRYRVIAASAADTAWLDRIPAGRPTLLLAEGISMYLTEPDGVALLRRVVDRFGRGELQMDFYNWLGVRSQRTHRLQRQSGSTLHWAVNSPADILDRVCGVRLLAATTFFDAATFDRAPAGFRRAVGLVRVIPPLRGMFAYHRYAFGPVS